MTIQLLRQLLLFLPNEMESGIVKVGCIKENETHCMRVVVLRVKRNETIRKGERRRSEGRSLIDIQNEMN
jgi:hypothetical protein